MALAYVKDSRFVLLTCLLLGLGVWWYLLPEPLLVQPTACCSPECASAIKEAAQCQMRSLGFPCIHPNKIRSMRKLWTRSRNRKSFDPMQSMPMEARSDHLINSNKGDENRHSTSRKSAFLGNPAFKGDQLIRSRTLASGKNLQKWSHSLSLFLSVPLDASLPSSGKAFTFPTFRFPEFHSRTPVTNNNRVGAKKGWYPTSAPNSFWLKNLFLVALEQLGDEIEEIWTSGGNMLGPAYGRQTPMFLSLRLNKFLDNKPKGFPIDDSDDIDRDLDTELELLTMMNAMDMMPELDRLYITLQFELAKQCLLA
ncbi:UNVERIFIED_CONTAM: protein Ycf2 [Sesamum calycinum]|uniref:Protein Ycf2 n=1 Tax=Sesamum calycinum TaxID=2727403 RepID=A0AAW2JK27_9LAMI